VSAEDARRVKDFVLPPWLAKRGLTLSEEKTRIVHLTEGFDFLSFNVRHYRRLRSASGYRLNIRPSKKAVNALREHLREKWLGLKGRPLAEVFRTLNPIIRGWANYHRPVCAKKTFEKLDRWMHTREKRYVKHMHPKKSTAWRKEKYWGPLNRERKDRWVFGDKRTGQYLLKFSWTKIVRHRVVRGTASPDDASLREYWWSRRKSNIRRLTGSDARLAEAQDWRCPVCGMDLLNGEELHRHHRVPRSMGGTESYGNRELVHLYCHQQRHAKLWRVRAEERLSRCRK
jgi:RNA-directed DNA polymerase